MKPYFIYIAIGIVLIAGVLVWAPWSPSMYKQYAISREMPIAKGADSSPNLAKGAQLYNLGKYEDAKKLLQSEYMANPQNPSLAYYFAITLVETRKEYEARTIFMHLHKGTSAFKNDAAYYAGLSLLKEGDKPAAIEWLRKVPEGTANAQKSKELIAALHK